MATAAALAAAEPRRRRPAVTRYPIPLETFQALKRAAAGKGKVLKKAESEKVQDKGKSTVTALAGAGEGAMTPVTLGGPVSAAPSAVAGFAGPAMTGSFPADCTLAAGPAHVAAAVNTTIAIYPKAGGSALLEVSLRAWFSNVLQGAMVFDPKLLYDQHENRWVLVCVAIPSTAGPDSRGFRADDSLYLRPSSWPMARRMTDA